MTQATSGLTPDGATAGRSDPALSCWIVTEGHAGSENQCIGLAEAMGVDYETKHVHPRAPWTWLPVWAWPAPLAALSRDSDVLAPPWPDLLIASGRRSIPYAWYVARRSGGRTYTVYIQNPRAGLGRFDAVITPAHDGVAGANVIVTKGAIHRVTPERIAEEASRLADRVAHLPRPLVTVLVGGSNKIYRMTENTVRELADRLKALAARDGVGLLVTPSRRTGAANIRTLRAALADAPAEVWDLEGDNPYFGYLGLADHIVVTGDSVTMISEACATGKPVYVVELEGGSPKFRRFHATMQEAGHTRPFDGTLDPAPARALTETADVAAEIRHRIAARRSA